MAQRRRKRSKAVDTEEESDIDRLSDLPDCILHHIMSFLDTGSLVRTELLSKRWGSLWKDAPIINFKRSCFSSDLIFKEHVSTLLYYRARHGFIGRVNLDYHFPRSIEQPDINAFFRVMKHVNMHGSGHLQSLSLSTVLRGTEVYSPFCPMVASIAAFGHYESLTTLELGGFAIGGLHSFCFNLLTTLKLSRCHLVCEHLLGGFPSLKYLKLVGCTTSGNLQVSGLKLLDLDIQCGNNLQYSGPILVFAPELKSFNFVGVDEGCKVFPELLNVPTLNRASIRIRWRNEDKSLNGEVMNEANRACMSLLRSLHNVESLTLCFNNFAKYDLLHNSPFAGMKSLMEDEPSPFTRLKALKVQYKKGVATVPYEVIRYFFEGCRSEGQTFLLEKIR